MFDWDDRKNARNLAKRRIAFERAYEFDWATLQVFPTYPGNDPVRFLLVGYLDDRLYSAVVTPRGDLLRLISLRPANTREERLYEAAI